MGYNVNMGLGRDGQGRMDPIEITVRPRNRGLGYPSEEVNDPAPKVEEIFFEEEDEEEQVRRFKEEAASLDKALKKEAAEANRASNPPTLKVRNPTKKGNPVPSLIIRPKNLKQEVKKALMPYERDREEDYDHVGVEKQLSKDVKQEHQQLSKALMPYESEEEEDD
ncbi:Uncharacterized protein Rs2_00220 [Raphanus sativus]|nr:Uncharacterized protein Rs2_00220 [Raphanus sativus]